MQHQLKTWPEFFSAVRSGMKTFELRKNDRDFQVGDTLLLEEYNPVTKRYTGNVEVRKVTYVTPPDLPPEFGLLHGFVIMGFEYS